MVKERKQEGLKCKYWYLYISLQFWTVWFCYKGDKNLFVNNLFDIWNNLFIYLYQIINKKYYLLNHFKSLEFLKSLWRKVFKNIIRGDFINKTHTNNNPWRYSNKKAKFKMQSKSKFYTKKYRCLGWIGVWGWSSSILVSSTYDMTLLC